MANKLALYTVIVICIMTLTASADYTKELQSVFVDDVIFDCSDWSAVQMSEGGTLTKYRYNWRERKSARWNYARMWNQTRFGIPADAVLYSGPMLYFTGGGQAGQWVEWICVHSVDMTPELRCNDVVYSNTSATFSYHAAWLRQPYMHWSDMDKHIDDVTCTYTLIDGEPAVRFNVEGHWTTKKNKYQVTGNKTILLPIDEVKLWQSVNRSVNVSVSNFTDRCMILSVETPPGITGIHIDAISPNMTALYEKHGYYMQLNKTESGHKFFDLKEHVFEDHSNMAPIGVDLYSLPKDNYNISITLYSPFEIIDANITFVETDPYTADAPKSPIKQVLCLIVVFSGIIFIGRSL